MHDYRIGLTALLLLVSGCKKSAGQTFNEGMAAVCSGSPAMRKVQDLPPNERQAALPQAVEEHARWVKENVTNKEVITVMAEMASGAPANRQRLISDALSRAELTECPMLTGGRPTPTPTPSPSGDRVTVDSTFLPGVDPAIPIVAIGRSAISYDGAPVIPLNDYNVDPAELSETLEIPNLKSVLAAQQGPEKPRAPEAPVFYVHAAPETPMSILFQVSATLATVSDRLGFLVEAKGELVALQWRLPKLQAQDPSIPADLDQPPLQLIVSLESRRAILWSVSGLEGTLGEPLLALDLKGGDYPATEIAEALTEIIARRFPEGERPPQDYDLLLQAAGDVTFAKIAPVWARLSHTKEGERFFDITLVRPIDD